MEGAKKSEYVRSTPRLSASAINFGTCQCGTEPPVPPLSFDRRHFVTVCTLTSTIEATSRMPPNFAMIVAAGS
ncbi:hypothetical protein SAMN05216566_12542 [Aureimonas phyllosphaerae]|nr:hypothetical protein SAMN05216566_12542 [Aureimonas phyllosphaerae]